MPLVSNNVQSNSKCKVLGDLLNTPDPFAKRVIRSQIELESMSPLYTSDPSLNHVSAVHHAYGLELVEPIQIWDCDPAHEPELFFAPICPIPPLPPLGETSSMLEDPSLVLSSFGASSNIDFNGKTNSMLEDPSLALSSFGASSNVNFNGKTNLMLEDPSLALSSFGASSNINFNGKTNSMLEDPSLALSSFGASSNVNFNGETNSMLEDPSFSRVLPVQS